MFVAPDDSDDEDLSNCDVENHLKYKFLTDEIEQPQQHATLSTTNGNHHLEQIDRADTASIDSNQKDGPSVIDRYLKHTQQYLPVKRTDSKD